MVMKVRKDYYTGTNAQRTAYAGSLHVGVEWLESDTGDIYRYTGSSWILVESGGASLYTTPAESPDGTVVRGADVGVPGAATSAFSSQTATSVIIKFKQVANAGSAQQYGMLHVVFNSSDAATDLADATVRATLAVGDEIAVNFSSTNPCTSMDYLASNTSADLAVFWEYK